MKRKDGISLALGVQLQENLSSLGSSVGKAGVCPTPPPGRAIICPVMCGSDGQCPGKQKCCNYGCLWHCMEPK
uniref:WAP domain-containing protein n=1 Tax=Laticauda laticaudata TaxID=8630 RepID=A0A8C5WW15_LATLA